MAVPAPGAAPVAPRFICFLCKRKFPSAALLTRHKQLSELHRWNLAKQDEELHNKKEEIRQGFSALRRQLQDVEQSILSIETPGEDLLKQRVSLDGSLQRAFSNYGAAQEKLEASRAQHLSDLGNMGYIKRSGVHETRLGKLSISAGAASWQGNKDVQEDRFILEINVNAPGDQKIIGFVVMDGHAGSLCVDFLMEAFPRNLQKSVKSKASIAEDVLRQAVQEACILTDDEFLTLAREKEVLDGSTFLACLIFPDPEKGQRMMLVNIGDSRAVLCQSQGSKLAPKRLTEDQKPGRPDERKRVEANGGVVDMQGVWRVFTPGPASFGGRSLLWGLAVSRAFGDLLMKEPHKYGCVGATGELVSAMPEISVYDLDPSEDRFVILACDGVWDVVNDEEAVAICSEHRSADGAAEALTRRCFEIGSDDNITTLVIAWQDAPSEPEGKRARS